MFPSVFDVRHCQGLPRHCGRRCQARTIALQLCRPDWLQRPQMLYARLRAMDPPAFQELRLFAFDRASRMAVRDDRNTADAGINNANCLILAIRRGCAILPDYVLALDTVGHSRRRHGISGPPGPHRRISVNHSGTSDKVTERSTHDVLTCGQVPIFYRDRASSINTPRKHS